MIGIIMRLMASVRLFAAARVAAGSGLIDRVDGHTVSEVLDSLRSTYGEPMAEVLASSACWVNQQPASLTSPVSAEDEVAILPPVSGG